MGQNALTILVPVLPDRVKALSDLLTQIGTHLRANSYLDVSRLTTTHFLRWVILPAENDSSALLLFESNHDDDAVTYLRDLLIQAPAALDAIYQHCAGFPLDGAADAKSFQNYLLAHSIPVSAFYIGYRRRRVETVKAALAARQKLAQFLDDGQSRHAFDTLSPTQIWAAVQGESARLGIEPLRTPPSVPPMIYALAGGVAALGLAALLTRVRGWPGFLAVTAAGIAFLRWREIGDTADWNREGRARYLPSFENHAQVQSLAVQEDILTQNQLTHVVRLKPGVFRHLTLKSVLGAVHLLAKLWFNQGNLGGIPSIHFARWVLLDDGRLLFFSNYDGSWDNYLGDFVDRAASGLTGVWSNTEDFPPTRFLLGQGARQIEFFKAWTRAHQVPTQVWYSAYPDSTVGNIRDAVQTLENLGQMPTSETAAAWLRRF